MGKEELLQNLYQVQEFMSCDIFNAEPHEDEEENEQLNIDLKKALDVAVECVESTYNQFKAMKGAR